jgi:hypothetical protein
MKCHGVDPRFTKSRTTQLSLSTTTALNPFSSLSLRKSTFAIAAMIVSYATKDNLVKVVSRPTRDVEVWAEETGSEERGEVDERIGKAGGGHARGVALVRRRDSRRTKRRG